MARKVHLVTFGCQMNKLDSELIVAALTAAGHETVATVDEADTVLFNTCSVRDQAENRVLSHVGMLKEQKENNPRFLIGVMGCMAQRLGEKLQRNYPQIDLVIGTRSFHRIGELLAEAESAPVVCTDDMPLSRGDILPEHTHQGGPSAWVAVMRGCNNFCAYCIVPYVRGREESRPVAEIVTEVKKLVAGGAREVTLLGQSVDKYGLDLEPTSSLDELLRAVHDINELKRLRFVTAHPRNITSDLFQAIAGLPKVCEHLHMPAQSGSDHMLKAMNRGYTAEHYLNLLDEGQRIVPGMAFASDFIVGFPGETDDDFTATLKLVQEAKFQNIFAFRYSPRPGTKAADLPDDVPQEIKEERLQLLLKAQEEVQTARNAALVGSNQNIMIESISKRDDTKMAGRTRQGNLVMIPAPEDKSEQHAMIGNEYKVEITKCTALTLFGKIAE